jgi:ferritin-like metal-binding protein YciE
MNDLQKLFVTELSDIYDAEQQIVKALPEMAKVAKSPELRDAFNRHLEQTKNHVRRVEEVFRNIGEEPTRKSCKGMEGIIDEGQLASQEFSENTALDAALICSAQKVEHYEITSYGCLCAWAEELRFYDSMNLLKENLSEEKQTDEMLTEIAERSRNVEAIAHDTEKKGEVVSSFKKVVSSGT